ncbi:winged helix-turn-helix domain-containing protein [Acidianus manzaensis]|uniref:ArnR1-like winged helix-turn-helix domain-containing protein n=1 Tax=Acidianus manzaensis TaxID=282676 RepID=A0A1W6JWJ8_9CREN|nr:winged helix-turn-helix domain-containing protein [Acidianus manzaensis]ARM74638.1 hypothetical protein B6F84_00430 [Acidianus manzaensis]
MTEKTKRSHYEIIYDVLLSCINGTKKTRLMYNANLSFQLLNKYLDLLINKGLIMKKDDKYVITEKGLQYIKYHQMLKEKKHEIDEILKKLNECIQNP